MRNFAKILKDRESRMDYGGAAKSQERDVQIWRVNAENGLGLGQKESIKISSEAKTRILEKIDSLQILLKGKQALLGGEQTVSTKTLINSTQTKIEMAEMVIEGLAKNLTTEDKRSLLSIDYFKVKPSIINWNTTVKK